MRWIRVASRVADDAKVWAIADDAGADGFKIVGHLVTLWGVMTEQAKDGDLSRTTDTVLERWARWDGARGAFAQAVRAHLCDAAGVVSAWEAYQGAAIREAETDRVRAANRRKSGKSPADGRPDGPADGPTEVRRYEDENENEINCTTTTARVLRAEGDRAARVARLVGAFDGPEQLGDAFAAVADALPPTGDRDLVMEVLARAATGPDSPAKFLRAMHNALVPLGGKAATPAQLGMTLLDWLEKADEPTFRLFTGYVRRAHLAELPQARSPSVRPAPAGGARYPTRDTAGRDTYALALDAALAVDAEVGPARPAPAPLPIAYRLAG